MELHCHEILLNFKERQATKEMKIRKNLTGPKRDRTYPKLKKSEIGGDKCETPIYINVRYIR